MRVPLKTAAQRRNIFLGPIIFAVCALGLSQTLTSSGAQALGLLAWMAFWWVTRPVNMAVTALLPLVIVAIFEIAPIELISSQYASDCVILLLGSGLLTMPWKKVGLDRRVALKALSLIGTSMRSHIIVWYLASVILSSILPNVIVCALFCLLAAAMLGAIGYTDLHKCEATTPILLSIGWGVGIGGVATPLGGAQNIISVTIFESITGKEFMYIDWVIRIFPYFIIGTIVLLICILLMPRKINSLEGTKEYFKACYAELGPMKRDEKICAILFILSVVAAFIRPLYDGLFPALTPAYTYLLLGMLCFFIIGADKQTLLSWKTAQEHTMWDLLLLVGGGLALGTTITESGLTDLILDSMLKMSFDGGLTTVIFFAGVSRILAELAESTTSAAVMTPLVFSFAENAGVSPVPYFFIIIMAYSEALILPLGVRAIPAGYGLDINKMMKYGIPFSVITTVVVIIVAYIMMNIWPTFNKLPYLS